MQRSGDNACVKQKQCARQAMIDVLSQMDALLSDRRELVEERLGASQAAADVDSVPLMSIRGLTLCFLFCFLCVPALRVCLCCFPPFFFLASFVMCAVLLVIQ